MDPAVSPASTGSSFRPRGRHHHPFPEAIMGGFSSLLYGAVVYVFFLATFAYAIGFVGNVAVPRSVDVGPAAPLLQAVVVDLALLGVFAVQHSVMARQAFKRWW